MTKQTNKQPVFKVYEAGEDRCAELINGKFRAIEHGEVNTYSPKPERFQQERMMTLEEMYEEELSELFEDTIRAKWTMDGATTLKEAAQKLRDEADRLEALNAEGYELREKITDDYGYIVLELKPAN